MINVLKYIFFIFCPFPLFGQLITDINQYVHYQPTINYASSVSYGGVNGVLFYRNQWQGFNGAPKTSGIQVSTRYNKRARLGFSVYNDRIGIRNTNKIGLNYAYKLIFSRKSFLGFSISPTLSFRTIDYQKLIVNNINDPLSKTNYSTAIIPNFDAGVYYSYKKFYLGIAIPSILLGSRKSIYVQGSNPIKGLNWNVHIGREYKLLNEKDFLLSILIKSDYGVSLFSEISGFIFFSNKKFGIGGAYRTTNNILLMVNYKLAKPITLGYSYSNSFKNISSSFINTHELIIIFDKKRKVKKIRHDVLCPVF